MRGMWVDDRNKNNIVNEIEKAVNERRYDPLFVWSHYSYPQQPLITWGRWKLRYAYLAENWMVAVVVGLLTALGIQGFLEIWCRCDPRVLFQGAPVTHGSWPTCLRVVIGVVLGASAAAVLFGLNHLRQENLKDDMTMLAVYTAGQLNPKLRERFLPPVQKDESRKLPTTTNGAPGA